jgi:ribokinase
MSAIEILVLGSIHQDLVIRGPRLPEPGETVLGGQFYQVGGGKGANQAVACCRAGNCPVWLCSAVGSDLLGQNALSELADEGLVTEAIRESAQEATGVALILVDQEGENCISVASGANGLLAASDLPAATASVWKAGNYLLASLEVPWDTVAAALAQARAEKMATVLNPAPATTELAQAGQLKNVDLLTPNAQEASLITGIDVIDVPSARQAAELLQGFGPRDVIVTLGQQGLVLRQGEEDIHIAAEPVEAVDTTAAGDCFNGALVAALASGKSLSVAARWANGAAALSVGHRGAQPSLPKQQEIERWWQTVERTGMGS